MISTGLRCLVIAGLWLCAMSVGASAERRAALVIGNSNYQNVAGLPNPANDATAFANLLKSAGFDVVEIRRDLGIADMRRAMRDFSDAVSDADIAVVYYAGHGVEVDGVNYLVPVDAVLNRDVDVEDEALAIDRVVRTLDPARRLRLIILDACRDNPFARTMKRTIGSRSVGRGLAKVEPAGADTLIAFAAKAGSTASDGDGANSPFTAALVKYLGTPGLDLRIAFGQVRDEVLKVTSRKQEPFVYGSLGGGLVSLMPLPDAKPAAPGRDEIAWNYLRDTTDMVQLRRFTADFPASERRAEAEKRIAVLEREAGIRADDEQRGRAAADTARRAQEERDRAAAELQRRADEERRKIAIVVPPVPPTPPATAKPSVGIPPQAGGTRPLTGEQERVLRPKDSFRECDACPEMVVVGAGSFTMGSPASEKLRHDDEGPQHQVTFARPFAVGKFSVTFDEWDACVADGGCNGYKPSDRNFGRGRLPVIFVSWDDAKAYLAWLSRKTGKAYRLLSEAEREYVARAGTRTTFASGSAISSSQTNYNGTLTYDNGEKGEYRRRTVPVESFQPNPWGLYQTHGNVWEWTEDCYVNSYQGAPTDGSARTAGDCSRRVIRGGSWLNNPVALRAASRLMYGTATRDVDAGFRVARTLTQ